MKGVLLCGGKGTRLQPYTNYYKNKHLVQVLLDTPMLMLPLKTMKDFGVKEILLITSDENCGMFTELLKDGSHLGFDITYKVQKEPDGILGAIKLAKDFLKGEQRFLTVLGDNFHKFDWSRKDLKDIIKYSYFRLFVKPVKGNAFDYGIITEDGIIEKPKYVKDGNAVTGLYILPTTIYDYIDTFSKSARGEFEITELNNAIISRNKMNVENVIYEMNENELWLDCGSNNNLKQIRESLLSMDVQANPFENVFFE